MGATVYSVLVVDDQKDWCETLVRMVNELDHAAQGATTALAALRLLADGRFDIVLLDWKLVHELPHGDFGLLQTIKRCWPDIQVIMVSGWVTSDDLGSAAMQLGAAGFLNKPIPLDRLGQELERVMRKAKPQ